MNRLKHHIAYCCGAMERTNDNGAVWREDIQNFLWQRNIGIFNPVKKPFTDYPQEDANFYDMLRGCRSQGDFDTLEKFCKKIVSSDLHMIDLCNFVIAEINTDVHMAGSYIELTYAALEKKPVIIMAKNGKKDLPGFLWGLGLRHEMFFESWERVKYYIDYICYSERIDDLGKWRFIDYNKVFGKIDC